MTKFSVKERSSAVFECDLKDPAGAAIPAASLTELKLTLYDKTSGGIINGRNAQDVLNGNNVTVDASGHLVWTLQPADNAITDSAKDFETHIAVFDFTWNAGAKRHWHRVQLEVENETKITA